MSVLDPEPGLVGLMRVVSITVQPSPLSPQPPRRSISIWNAVKAWDKYKPVCRKLKDHLVREARHVSERRTRWQR